MDKEEYEIGNDFSMYLREDEPEPKERAIA